MVGGQLSGTVTLDSQGVAFLVVNLANDLATEGSETLTLQVAGLSANVTVNDTSKTPLVFTSTVGETLDGFGANDTFFGVVDRTGANDSGTFSEPRRHCSRQGRLRHAAAGGEPVRRRHRSECTGR